MRQDNFALHWPLVNSDQMRTRLAKRELEKKRIEDAHRCCDLTVSYANKSWLQIGHPTRIKIYVHARRLALADPNHRNEWQLKEIRAFTDAAVRMATREDREVTRAGPLTAHLFCLRASSRWCAVSPA